MTKPSLGSGNIDLSILDVEYSLKPTLRAAKLISKDFGGGLGAINRLSQFDFDAIVKIISAGLDLTPNGEKKFAEGVGLEEAIYKTGLMELAAPCIRYTHVLLNGGKPPSDETEGEAPLEESE
jgi:hypothetical protein